MKNDAYLEKIRMESVLRRHSVRLTKKYGQNFLYDRDILKKIVSAADIGKEDFVLEIGPGMGQLTKELSRAAGKVLAVEIDEKLLPILSEELEGLSNTEVVQGDIMKLPLPSIVGEAAGGRRVKVAANLPYYITTPILLNILEGELKWDSITVMVQKEVACRMVAGPGTKDYGALSLAVAYHSSAHICFEIGHEAFFPQPKVASAVVTLKRYETPPVEVPDKGELFKLIRAAFGQRRKTLKNALCGAKLPLCVEEIVLGLENAGISPMARGETLSLSDFARLAREYHIFSQPQSFAKV